MVTDSVSSSSYLQSISSRDPEERGRSWDINNEYKKVVYGHSFVYWEHMIMCHSRTIYNLPS